MCTYEMLGNEIDSIWSYEKIMDCILIYGRCRARCIVKMLIMKQASIIPQIEMLIYIYFIDSEIHIAIALTLIIL